MSQQPLLMIAARGMLPNCRWEIRAHTPGHSFSYHLQLESGDTTVCHVFASNLDLEEGFAPALIAGTTHIRIEPADIEFIRKFITETADYVRGAA